MDRLFVAVELPAEVKGGLGGIQDSLRKSSARLTLVDPAIIHITLKFIGDTPESATGQIAEVLGKVEGVPFPLQVKGIGGNNSRQPRVIWAHVDDGGRCGLLHTQIEDLLAPLGIRREDRAFRPHATVARVKEFHPDLLECIRPFRDRDLGGGMVRGFTLKKSVLTPRGPLYQDVKEVLF
ncbi:MAG: RNA 2',3'-cyclic phosphodiesterase [Methanolinea sp.]|jgi:2'-5' RNA ligase|nr:RNA 2',3'-cyclic phosphodiesterase [Methanolinea sp.]